MKVGQAIAEIMKREGIEILCGYPVNHLIEFAAAIDIRPIMVRQERIGLHMADALSRLTSGQKIGVFAMQHGPGAENAFGGVAQAYGEAVPILVLPMGYPRALAYVEPNFNSVLNMRGVTKSAEPIVLTSELPNVFRRAFTRLKSGRGGPVLVEIPRGVQWLFRMKSRVNMKRLGVAAHQSYAANAARQTMPAAAMVHMYCPRARGSR